jgi:hypothetical protein
MLANISTPLLNPKSQINDFSINTSNPAMTNLVLDGDINDTAWANADQNITFYLDVNNSGTPPNRNFDANNRLYLGEDAENLYIGLDLNSDQSIDGAGEWLCVFLNLKNRVFSSRLQWQSYFNDGTESLIYEVDNETVWDDNKGAIDPSIQDSNTTINSFTLKKAFGPSTLNASDHRMFEICIPKSELEHYDSNQGIGIIVGGYGTLSYLDTNYWNFQNNIQTDFREQTSTEYKYYNMKGVPPGPLTLTTDADSPDLDGAFNLQWTAAASADNYTVYQYGSAITSVHGSLTKLATEVTSLTLPVSNLANGTYYYAVSADNFGEIALSNYVKVIVGSPSGIPGIPLYSVIALLIIISVPFALKIRKNRSQF